MSDAPENRIRIGRMPEVGDVIDGRYRLDRVLARGGMGVIVRATQLSMDRTVVVKLLQPRGASVEQSIERFRREADVAKDLQHENIIQLHDFGQIDEGVLYMVMEYLEGRDLRDALEAEGRFTAGRACDVTLQILDGLAAAHDKGVIHRDLKPRNIFLMERRRGGDRVKVLDFGVAKSLDAQESSVTKTGMMTGTPMYLPPEVLFVQSPGPAGDVYAVGLMFLEMMTGERVVDVSDPRAALGIHLRTPITIPPALADTRLAEVLRKATAKHPEDRYEDADAMFEALREAQHSVASDLELSADIEIADALDPGSNPLEQVAAQPGSGMEVLKDIPSARSGEFTPDGPTVVAQTPHPDATGPATSTGLSADDFQLEPPDAETGRDWTNIGVIAAVGVVFAALGGGIVYLLVADGEASGDEAASVETVERDPAESSAETERGETEAPEKSAGSETRAESAAGGEPEEGDETTSDTPSEEGGELEFSEDAAVWAGDDQPSPQAGGSGRESQTAGAPSSDESSGGTGGGGPSPTSEGGGAPTRESPESAGTRESTDESSGSAGESELREGSETSSDGSEGGAETRGSAGGSDDESPATGGSGEGGDSPDEEASSEAVESILEETSLDE